jgi:hypothetical protein
MLQLDTAGVAGTIQLDLAVGGTAAAPTLQGTGSVADLSFGDFGSPFVQGIVDYRDRALDANLLLWKTGQTVLRVEAKLPLDLALRKVRRRQVDGPLSVRAIADSTDLAVTGVHRNLRRGCGTLGPTSRSADLQAPAGRVRGPVGCRGAGAGPGVQYDRTSLGPALRRLDHHRLAYVRSGEGTLRRPAESGWSSSPGRSSV